MITYFRKAKERGSLALEQVLFIGAVVVMSAGVFTFYTDIGSYFSTFNIDTVSKPSSTVNP